MAIQQKLYTIIEYEEFLAKHPEASYELINGMIVEKGVTQKHAQIVSNINGELYIDFKKNCKIKGHFEPEARFTPVDDQYNSRLPDISVHLTDDPIVEQGAVQGMPTLAVEVQSPPQTVQEMRDKAKFYIEHSCQMVWVIYPNSELIEVYQPNVDIELLTGDDALVSGDDILPDFEISLRDIFENFAG